MYFKVACRSVYKSVIFTEAIILSPNRTLSRQCRLMFRRGMGRVDKIWWSIIEGNFLSILVMLHILMSCLYEELKDIYAFLVYTTQVYTARGRCSVWSIIKYNSLIALYVINLYFCSLPLYMHTSFHISESLPIQPLLQQKSNLVESYVSKKMSFIY